MMGDDSVLLDSVNESRTPESSLLDHVERVAHSRSGRFAVHVKLSALQAHNRQPHHIRIASRSFDTLINATDAQIYILSNGDLFLLCRDLRIDDVDYVIDKVRTLFKGDPLTRPNPSTGEDDFATWFDLELDFHDLHETVSALAAITDRPRWVREDASAGRGASTEFAGQALDPVALGKIDDSIRRSRIADLVREQSAVIIGADGTERILFNECYVSIGELQRRHAPGFNLISNLWLFQHLTETIDSRLLAFLSHSDIAAREQNISINLNTTTVLSSVFQAFDQAIGAAAEKVTVEFQLVDIFADLDRYAEARDWLSERGYLVLIDGLNPMSIRYFDASLLAPNFVKVSWGDEFSGGGSIEDSAEMIAIVERIGAKRLILARTDSEDALTWALTHGIRRFQGFFIDKLVPSRSPNMVGCPVTSSPEHDPDNNQGHRIMALPPALPGQRVPSQESLLLDYLHRLETHRQDRRAIHIHLSRLNPQNRREHHIRIAATSFDPMIKSTSGQLFVLRNSDLFFIYKMQAQNDVETSMLRLKFLFGDDPLMADEDAARQQLSTSYDVETEFNEILSLARNLVHEDVADDTGADEPLDAKSELELRREQGEPLTPRVLGRVEQALQRADISNMMRRQFICGLIGQASPQPLFSELFISIADLRETLLPGVNLTSSRWLFQHLTETLDRRVLAFLSRSTDRSITGEISVNLNVSTVLSPEFMQFDDSVIAAMRGSLVIELQQVDIFGDLNAYLFARSFAKDHGYRICIDGLTAKTMPFIDRERLGADMVKLVWDAELLEDDKREEVSALVQRAGSTRVILCRCSDAAAVEWGQSIGINMFQGRHIENLIAADNRRRDIEAARRQPLSGEFIE